MASISLENVCITFNQRDYGNQSLKRLLLSLMRGKNLRSTSNSEDVPALRNISLQMNNGERVGLLGRNGAGKSTLLRVLSRVYDPHSGVAEISGHASSLLSLGLGFFRDLDGLQNILTSSVFYGADLGTAKRRCAEIAAFTELGDALNRPVRTYSSGMLMRLGFAVATAFEPEILLLDEVVGVGDWAFAEKASERIEALIGSVHILVLASHDENALRRFCKRGLVLESGQLVFDGPLGEAIDYYHRS